MKVGEAGAAFAFAACRLAEALRQRGEARPAMLAAAGFALHELGAPCFAGLALLGLDPGRSLLVVADKESGALWALDEALRSGAVAGGLVLAERPSFLMTKRLAFAAAKGEALGLILRVKPAADLSAARMRWRIAAMPSRPHALDDHAAGSPRWQAALVRQRAGSPAAFEVEWDDAADGLRVAAGLVDHGLGSDRRAAKAA